MNRKFRKMRYEQVANLVRLAVRLQGTHRGPLWPPSPLSMSFSLRKVSDEASAMPKLR